MTDGVMNADIAEDDLLGSNGVITRIKATYDPIMFTYSLGSGADADIPQKIACDTNGLWAQIPDGADLYTYMGTYYRLFAGGLSSNTDFVAWVEPYPFATGGEMGTTVSAPVYDRLGGTNEFLGVVGMDLTVAAMEEVRGEE